MGYIEGSDRYQMTYIPKCVDDYIEENNPVGVIDSCVDSLNMDDLMFARDPDFKTISDFRKDNKVAIASVFKHFTC